MPIDRFPKKPCKFCGGMGHFSYMCRDNPKNSWSNRSIKQNGKYAKQWMVTRATWIDRNPPPIEGKYWICYLQIHEWCPVKLTEKTLTLDHIVSRSRDPSLRFAADNLKPACGYCNNEKGSRSLEEVMASKGKRNLNLASETSDDVQ